jgi:phosphoglycolate phosphatase
MKRDPQDWPRAVVFDLDGTLIDSAPDIADALNRAIDRRGLAPFTVEKVKEMIGGGVPKLVERAVLAHGVSRIGLLPLAADFIKFYRQNLTTQTTLYEGARELLEQFQNEGRGLGLCTNKQHELTIDILNELDLAKYFSAVVGERMGRPRKPDPAPLRGVLSALGVQAGQAIMVGDSAADVGCAKAAGVASVVVSFGYSRIAPQDLGGDAIIESLNELPNQFRALRPRNEVQ